MNKKYNIIQITLFLTFIFIFSILSLILPDKEFSDQENRTLSQFPTFTFDKLISGSFADDYETYISDQFPLRDYWITFKAKCELLAGKEENNGIYYCKDNTLIPKLDEIDYSKIDKNISAINLFIDKVDIPVYFSLIPGAADIWLNKLPSNAPSADQEELIEYCKDNINTLNISLSPALSEHSDEYIYYRTDHHWTSLGAYYAYNVLINTIQPSDYTISKNFRTVSENFYGTSSSTSGFSWVNPDEIQICNSIDNAVVERYEKGVNSTPEVCDLYDESYLNEKDKYSMFLGGVCPLIHIKSNCSNDKSILLIRDSYSDSLSPYLTESFSDIYLVDLRYYKTSVTELINNCNIDNVLIIYSVSNFSTDNNLILLAQ